MRGTFKLGFGVAALGYITAIFVLSSSEGRFGPSSIILTKLLHIPLYAGLTWCLLLTATGGHWYRAVSWRVYAVVGVIATACAALDEGLQAFVPGRSASLLDFVLNSLGVAGSLGIYRWLLPLVVGDQTVSKELSKLARHDRGLSEPHR